jgi:glycosyltransferase involved in cell wall biosynthesis
MQMRILVVVHDFAPGGVERIALRLASQWAADGDRVAIACGNPAGALEALARNDEVQVLTPEDPIARSRFSRHAVALFAVRAAREFEPDVIFLPGNFYAGMAMILRLRLGRRGPAIVLRLSNMLRRTGRRWAGEAAFLAGLTMKTVFADHIVAMSPELLEEARQSLPWSAEQFSVIAEPVLDADAVRVAPRREVASHEPPLLVAAGRLTGQKNFAMLIEAAARLDRPFRLIIYGEGPQQMRLENSIATLGLAARVTLAGYVDDLQPALSSARLFILSSDYEGFPAVLVEALGAGVPVVATDCSPAIAGIVAKGAGILVPVGDPTAMAKAIATSLDRPPLNRQRLAASVNRYRLDQSAAAYRDLFGRFAKADDGPRRQRRRPR